MQSAMKRFIQMTGTNLNTDPTVAPSWERPSFRRVLFFTLLVLSTAMFSPVDAQDATEEPQTMSLDVKEMDIRDAIRMISKGYNLNIILDKEVTGKVTLHLTDVPIMKGLRSLAESQGLEVRQEGNVYRIGTAPEKKKSIIRFHRGKLSLDIQNMDVLKFIEEVSSKTAASIVPDSKIEGQLTGKLYQVPLDDGLRAILEGNGYDVQRRRGIYHVSQPEQTASSTPRRRTRFNKGGKDFYVDFSRGLLSLDVTNGNLSDVLQAIAEQSDMEVVTYGNVTDEVNAKLYDLSLTEALALLLGGTKYTFVQKGKVILIGNRNTATPSGQALSTSDLVHLRHIKADEIQKILPKNIPQTNIKVVKEQNALLVSGTSEDIVQTKEFLNTVDIPTPQVVIDVIVVEFNRSMTRELGIEGGGGGEDSHMNWSFPGLLWNRSWESFNSFRESMEGTREGATKFAFFDKSPSFYLKLKALEEAEKARVLAHPSITVLNGNKATINVGETRYHKIIGGTSENPTYRFQPINFGINVDITPWISQSGQITAEVSPKISNQQGINDEGLPNVFERSVTTTVRLDDGQTLVLGGLLNSSEGTQNTKIPILGDLPILGHLFKSTAKHKTQTNLVIYITPHVIRKSRSVDLRKELERFQDAQHQSLGEYMGINSDEKEIEETIKGPAGALKMGVSDQAEEFEEMQLDTSGASSGDLGSDSVGEGTVEKDTIERSNDSSEETTSRESSRNRPMKRFLGRSKERERPEEEARDKYYDNYDDENEGNQ